MATISSQLRLTRFLLRFIQLYLLFTFALIMIFPGRLGRKLFRLAANLLDTAAGLSLGQILNRRQITSQEDVLAGVKCTWFTHSRSKQSTKVIVYIHGGGFMLCSSQTHAPIVAAFAANIDCSVLFVNYALAPENTYPHALDQIVLVYRELLSRNYASNDIIIGGDSAGGGLTLSLLMRLRDEGGVLPSAAFVNSQLVDLSCSGASINANARYECILPAIGPFTAVLYRRTFARYVGNATTTHPYVSPLLGDFSNLPPLHISFSEHETLRDDSQQLVVRTSSQGAKISVYSAGWIPHAALVLHQFFPEGLALYQDVENFLKLHFANSPDANH